MPRARKAARRSGGNAHTIGIRRRRIQARFRPLPAGDTAPGEAQVRLPGPAEWLFSIRTFAAAVTALLIGLTFDLDRPYWAMASAYIASQPLSGATRSKAAYRFLGTLLG